MHRHLAPALALGLGLLSACQVDPGVQGGADLREEPDLRTSPGNTVLGVACDETRPCPTDPKGGGPARCVTIVEFDQVGACAPACSDHKDCDTILPGDAYCTQMTSIGKRECVLFCDRDKRIGGRECPAGWSCVSSQGFRICRPPQDKATPDGGAS